MRFLLFILISFIAFIGSASAAMKRYDDHVVIRCNASSTAAHQSVLSTLRHMKEFHVDAWSKTDYMFHRSHLKNVEKLLSVHGLGYSILHENVQSLIDREAKRLSQRKLYSFNDPSITSDDFFSDYRKFDEILLFFANLTAQYPGMIQKQSLGQTYQGNEQVAYIITSNKTDAKQKQAILFEGGIHSREWIAPATVTYIGAQLLEQYGTDSTITQLVDQFIWIIIPVVNIDGYDYSWTGDRMWRKTRSINAGSSCVGVDPNRNWNDHWCQAGADTDPCSDSYCGPSAFSEPCVKNVANFILNWQQDASHGKIISFIDFHSYSQLWMGPYGWTQSLPKDDTTIEAAGNAAVAAIQATTQMSYTEGPIYTTVYPASGSSADWGYGEAGIIYAFGVELRDQGQYGFQLPADQIVPSGQEILAAAKAMAQYILQNPNAASAEKTAKKGNAPKIVDEPIVAIM